MFDDNYIEKPVLCQENGTAGIISYQIETVAFIIKN